MNYKRKTSSTFMSVLGSAILITNRRAAWLKEIQETEPEFNYRDNDRLQFDIDLLEEAVKKLKRAIPNA